MSRILFVETGCGEREVSDLQDFGALNDRFDDLGCNAAKTSRQARTISAPAKAATAIVRNVRIGDLNAPCGKRPFRAHPVSSIFSLRARAARIFLHLRNFSRCRAAQEPVVRDSRSIDPEANSRIADEAVFRWSCTKVCC
ncbi:hypothetical protein [Ruegeria marisrubri]|uniref:hypothetical protein n=1 Tax=Ruegeria marisrubri TaxID=1685379 RepID=UPI000A881511|nr:hypothetical protein [Ruegeria marisrubri]